MSENAPQNADFEELLEYIRSDRGFDFTGYKRPSLARRIAKRLDATESGDYATYLAYLRENPDEFVELFDTILINVTAFFRDEVAWDYLRDEIVPRVVEARREADAIRVWSTGCASGEEAYSLAMIFGQALGEEDLKRRIKIYATDVDDEALNVGRHALYNSKQIEPVPAELRERYFDAVNGTYAFRKDLRRSVIFGRNDLLQDPPISKIDLLVSRNTLMYFDSKTQAHVLGNFHFALRDDGFLFLGKSEALAASSNLFAAIDLKRRMFAKVPTARRPPRLPAPIDLRLPTPDVEADARVHAAGVEAVPVAQIVVDRDGRVISATHQARTFFELVQQDIGRPFRDLEVSFRPVELRSRIAQAVTQGHVVTLREVEWRVGSDVRYLDVQVAPLVSPAGDGLGASVTFTEVTRYRRLQQALQESQHEMETAYEELQSTNEELETMNDELHERTVELNGANAFLDGVLGGLEAGVAVLNEELEVEAWNQGARELWGLTADETVGRHFLNLDIGLPVEQLRNPIRAALAQDDGQPEHLQIAAVNRRGRKIDCLVSMTPLRPRDGPPHGVIVMMQTMGVDGSG